MRTKVVRKRSIFTHKLFVYVSRKNSSYVRSLAKKQKTSMSDVVNTILNKKRDPTDVNEEEPDPNY